MPTTRKIIFANDYYYHIFNRGIDRRSTFINTRDYSRALDLMHFYQFNNTPIRHSHYSRLPHNQKTYFTDIMLASGKKVEIAAYCLMPNHFHILLKQKKDKGVITYISNFINAYTKYFNTKNKRSGQLFQGSFKAIHVDSDEYLLHLTRYIHLNPVVSSIVTVNNLKAYKWTSYPGYISNTNDNIVEKDLLKTIIPQTMDYKKFVSEQISYARKLHKIKHLVFE